MPGASLGAGSPMPDWLRVWLREERRTWAFGVACIGAWLIIQWI